MQQRHSWLSSSSWLGSTTCEPNFGPIPSDELDTSTGQHSSLWPWLPVLPLLKASSYIFLAIITHQSKSWDVCAWAWRGYVCLHSGVAE